MLKGRNVVYYERVLRKRSEIYGADNNYDTVCAGLGIKFLKSGHKVQFYAIGNDCRRYRLGRHDILEMISKEVPLEYGVWEVIEKDSVLVLDLNSSLPCIYKINEVSDTMLVVEAMARWVSKDRDFHKWKENVKYDSLNFYGFSLPLSRNLADTISAKSLDEVQDYLFIPY